MLVTEEFLEEYNFFCLPIHFKSGASLGFPCPPDSVRSIRELSALKTSSTPTCSRAHHHPQQPPSYPKGEGRWSRRVVSRGSPDLKSGASRPSLSIRCTGKRNVSGVLTHEHRRELAGRRRTGRVREKHMVDRYAKLLGLLHVATWSSTRSRACLALWSSCEDSCTHRCMAHPPSPPFQFKFTLLLQFDQRVDVHRKWCSSQCGSFLLHKVEIS